MSNLNVIPVNTHRERLSFIKMPWQIYQNEPHWVPPLIFDQMEFLDPKKGVFYEYGEVSLFLALRNGKAVGRISSHINPRYEEIYKSGKGFFGFFECEDNLETARALFNAAENNLRLKGNKLIEGPFSFSTYDEMGVLVDGFDSDPYVMNMHNPAYYQKLIEACGFEKSVDWYAFRGRRGKTDRNIDQRYYKVRERLLKNPSIKIRSLGKTRDMNKEADIVKGIFHKAWDQNWGHIALTDREWTRFKNGLIGMVIKPMTFIAEVDGKPAGFALSIYDANQAVKKMNGRLFPFGFLHLLQLNKTDRFRLILMGVLEEYRNLGLEIAMYLNIIDKGIKNGFSEVEMSNIVETNKRMMDSLNNLDIERYKTYRIFIKKIT